MTKMQIWSKETPRRLLRKKPKKKAGLLEAPRQLPLHTPLLLFYLSFSRERVHTSRCPFLFSLLLSRLSFSRSRRSYVSLPEAFTATWFEPDLPLHCWDPPDICLACSLKFPCRCVNAKALFLSIGLIELRNPSTYFSQTFPACKCMVVNKFSFLRFLPNRSIILKLLTRWFSVFFIFWKDCHLLFTFRMRKMYTNLYANK